MSVNIDSESYIKEALRIRGINEASDNVIDRAAGTLFRRLPVEARRDLQEEINLNASRIRDSLNVKRGKNYVELTGYARGIGLINFGGRASKSGFSFQIYKKGNREKLSHAFVRTPRSISQTGPQVFVRTERIGNLSGGAMANKKTSHSSMQGRYVGRYPIQRLFGPSIASQLRDEQRHERLVNYAQKILVSEIFRMLGK